MTTQFCPYCGHATDDPVPLEFKGLQLRPKELWILYKLWEAHGRIVLYTSMRCSSQSAHVYMCRIREALRDIGSSWRVQTVYQVGWFLEKIEGFDEASDSTKRSEAPHS